VRLAGQDSEALIAARNGDSTAPFAPECQSFLDNLPAGFGLIGSCSDGSEDRAFAALRSPELSRCQRARRWSSSHRTLRFPPAENPFVSGRSSRTCITVPSGLRRRSALRTSAPAFHATESLFTFALHAVTVSDRSAAVCEAPRDDPIRLGHRFLSRSVLARRRAARPRLPYHLRG
jgi:hypothetical protein